MQLNTSILRYSFLPTLLVTLIPNIGTHRYWALMEIFGSPEQVLQAPPETLPFINQDGKSLIRNYQRQPECSKLMQSACRIIDTTTEHQSSLLCSDDEQYPSLLKEIHHPPPLLFIKGCIENLSLPQLAIIGSRNATHSGLQNTRSFAKHLSQSGFTITSGLALGIDGAAHQATLDAQGKTIGVMATGIDDIYPKRHHYLAHQIIAEGGTLVSEFTPNTPPKANHFPRRNRIISGLSLGVLIIEAAIKSGSLITANYALEQGREVFSIPGSIHQPQSKGCHQLIKNGATLVEESADIVDHLDGILGHLRSHSDTHRQVSPSTIPTRPALGEEETLIMEHLGHQPTRMEQLLQSTSLTSDVLAVHLTNLEINGWITLSDWGYERV